MSINRKRVRDIEMSSNSGYLYDLAIISEIRKGYTMSTYTPLILNISDRRFK